MTILIYIPEKFDRYKLFLKSCDEYLSHLYSEDNVNIKVFTPRENHPFIQDITEYFSLHDITSIAVINDDLSSAVVDAFFMSDCMLIFNDVTLQCEIIKRIKSSCKELEIKHRIIDYKN